MVAKRQLQIIGVGAGVQSSVLVLKSCLGELPRVDCGIFSDTMWEPTAVYEHLNWLQDFAEHKGMPIHRVTAGNLRAEALSGGRWASMPLFTLTTWYREDLPELQERLALAPTVPIAKEYRRIIDELKHSDSAKQRGMIRRQCTDEYKIEPINQFVRGTLLGLRPRQRASDGAVRHWFGISFDEWQRMRTSSVKWRVHYYPLVDLKITREACLEWLRVKGLPIPPRSACIGCPYHNDHEWRDMKINRPAEFEDACCFDDSIRNRDGLDGQGFLHRECVPLRDIDFRTDFDKGQLPLFQPECDGWHCMSQ